jgi:hypothetical protein
MTLQGICDPSYRCLIWQGTTGGSELLDPVYAQKNFGTCLIGCGFVSC